METTERRNLLHCHIAELPFTKSLTNTLASDKIYSLSELLELKVHEMLLIPHFTMHHLMEITQFLQDHQMNQLLVHE